MWVDDIDYFEYNEFDQMLYEFKESLRNSVKQEVLDKIANLEKELDKYKDIKANYEAKMSQMNNTITEYNKLKDELQRNQEEKLRKLAYTDIFKGDTIDAYGICYAYDYITPKCDKCDDHRQIHFKSPSGVDHCEPCSCAKQICRYDIIPAKLTRIESRLSRGKKRCNDILYFEYTVKKGYDIDDEDHILDRVTVHTLENLKLTDDNYNSYRWQVTQHGAVFLNKEDAQTVCDWLNNMSIKELQEDKNKNKG
jgi:hypothetical protein